MRRRPLIANRIIQILSSLFVIFSLGCEIRETATGITIFQNCDKDDYSIALKKLAYSELVHNITMDTVFIVTDKIPLYDTIPYYKSSIDYFFLELPIQIDTGRANVEIINSSDHLNCLLEMQMENIKFQKISEKELAEKETIGRKNYYFRFSDFKLFKKEKLFGFVFQRLNKTFHNDNYFLIDKKNHTVFKMSRELE